MTDGLSVRVQGALPDVDAAVRAALATQGFGVLTEIDVQATMKAKIGAELAEYVILGACNPTLAFRAISADPRIGVLLPCNVVLRRDGDAILVEAVDPGDMVTMTGRPELAPVAAEATAKLQAALAQLA